jgi:hypothetical protein
VTAAGGAKPWTEIAACRTECAMTMLSSLHLYPKTPRDLVVKTKTGGLISLVALAVMGFLFFTELTAYLYSRFETTLSLDDNNDQKLLIDFQLELPKMPCHVVGVEVSDVFGTHKVNSASNVFKHKLDADGKRGELVGGSVSSTAAGEQMAQSGRANFLLETPPVRDESDFEQSPLAPADFDAAVESFDLVLVDFFAPWCRAASSHLTSVTSFNIMCHTFDTATPLPTAGARTASASRRCGPRQASC